MSKSKPAVQTYHILDKGMRYVGAIRLKPGQKTVDCTEAEAKFFVEGGGLSLTDPAEARKAARAEAAKADEPAPAPETAPVAGDALAVSADAPEADAGKPAAGHRTAKAR